MTDRKSDSFSSDAPVSLRVPEGVVIHRHIHSAFLVEGFVFRDVLGLVFRDGLLRVSGGGRGGGGGGGVRGGGWNDCCNESLRNRADMRNVLAVWTRLPLTAAAAAAGGGHRSRRFSPN